MCFVKGGQRHTGKGSFALFSRKQDISRVVLVTFLCTRLLPNFTTLVGMPTQSATTLGTSHTLECGHKQRFAAIIVGAIWVMYSSRMKVAQANANESTASASFTGTKQMRLCQTQLQAKTP